MPIPDRHKQSSPYTQGPSSEVKAFNHKEKKRKKNQQQTANSSNLVSMLLIIEIYVGENPPKDADWAADIAG